MPSASLRHVTFFVCFLIAPAVSLATTIDVNGGTIGAGGSVSAPFSFTVDSGLIDVNGDYSASNPSGGPGTTIELNATAVYEGITPLASAFSFTIDDIQNYVLTTLPAKASYFENAGFFGSLGAGSELIADLTYGADSLPTLTFTANGFQSTP